MRRLAFSIALIVFCTSVLGIPSPAAASVSAGVSVMFHDSLAPYGDWVERGRFGIVWAPRYVEHGWRPYTRGHWVYTDYDWTWVSDEDWGWATDHYGRWYLDPVEGWLWIPGDEWAPAWVAWRHGGGYVGWAPLPPEVDVFRVGFELRIDPFAYSFVEERHLCDHAVYRHFAPVARNATYVNITRNVTNYAVVNHRVVNRGVDVQHIERITGHAVARAQVREVASASEARGGHVRRGQVAFYRPPVTSARPNAEPRVHAFARPPVNAARPDQLIRRQEKEQRQLESAEHRERGQLRKIQERENRRPPVVAEEHGAARPRPPASLERGQLRARHEAEQRAQAEHEQRERQMLQQRQERERHAAHVPPQNERGAKAASKHDHP
jgi:hypothetical protein